jgi:hypothetical protein
MQISKAQAFAFVEGGLDRPFVESLLRLFAHSETKVRVTAIKEISSGTGGKPALLAHFRRLKRKDYLLATAWGKPFISLFFVDKDADDALGKLLRSPHVLYTPAYDLEGTLFACGDVTRALASACLITSEQSQKLIGEIDTFLRKISENWADWMTMCLISQYKKKNIGCTFDRVSLVNPDPLHPADEVLLNQWRERLRVGLAISDVEFDRLYLRFRRVVDRSIAAGEPLRYFRGKWIKHVLQRALEGQARIPDANINAVAERALSVLVSQVAYNPQCLCCKHYEPAVRAALAQIEYAVA